MKIENAIKILEDFKLLQFPVIKEAIETVLKEIKELEAINAIQKYRIDVIDERELICKEKIKEKIEEYKKQIEKMEKDDIGIGFTLGKEWSDLKSKVEFGQSLLEEE